MREIHVLWRAKRCGIGRENALESLLTFIPFAHSPPAAAQTLLRTAPSNLPSYRRNDARRNLLYTRCTYRRYRKKTCSGLHGRAQVDGVGKQRVLSRTGTFPGKLPHQFDSDPRVSLLARALPSSGTRANRKNVYLKRRDRFQSISALSFFDRVADRSRKWNEKIVLRIILFEYNEGI